MKECLRRLRTPGPWLFRQAWSGYAEVKRLHPGAEAWRRSGEGLRGAWEAFMQSILSPTAWTALCLLLERQYDLRWLWIKPGGYFYTKAGNRRKVIRKKLVPRIITVTLRDRLAHAEHIYYESLKSEVFDSNAVVVMTLALAGSITGGKFSAATAHIKREPLRQRRKRWRLWLPSRTSSLRYLRDIGFLQQSDDDGPLL